MEVFAERPINTEKLSFGYQKAHNLLHSLFRIFRLIPKNTTKLSSKVARHSKNTAQPLAKDKGYALVLSIWMRDLTVIKTAQVPTLRMYGLPS